MYIYKSSPRKGTSPFGSIIETLAEAEAAMKIKTWKTGDIQIRMSESQFFKIYVKS